MSRARSVVAAVAVVAAIGCGALAGGGAPTGGRSPLAAAVASVPADVTVLGFTDWESILGSYSIYGASERDLSSRSYLIDVDLAQLRSALGWRLSDLAWEVYAQDTQGDVAVVRVKGDVPSAKRLRASGYKQEKGVWAATGRIASRELLYRYVAPLPRSGLVVISNGPQAVSKTVEAITGRGASLADSAQVADTVKALGGVQTAHLQIGALGCDATQAGLDPDTAAQVRAAQERFGRLARYRWLGRGLRDDGSDLQTFTAAMTFASAAQASEQVGIRAAMSSGPFIGRSGDMSEVLRLASARSDGATGVLTYRHPANSEFLMPGRGPLLPVSC